MKTDTVLLLIIALVGFSIISGVVIMNTHSERTANVYTASTVSDNADEAFVIESESFENNRSYSDNGTQYVFINSSNVNGNISNKSINLSIDTYDGEVEVNVAENIGEIQYNLNSLNKDRIQKANTGLCIAGLGGDNSQLQVESIDNNASVTLKTNGSGKKFKSIERQYEECTGESLSYTE